VKSKKFRSRHSSAISKPWSMPPVSNASTCSASRKDARYRSANAVRHPERVTPLILYDGYTVGWEKRSRSAAEKEQGAAMLTLMRHG
jgi:hypothetical protein